MLIDYFDWICELILSSMGSTDIPAAVSFLVVLYVFFLHYFAIYLIIFVLKEIIRCIWEHVFFRIVDEE